MTPETLALVPIKLIFHYHLLPLGIEDDCLTLAFSEPPSQMEQGNLRLLLSKRFKIILATPSSIHAVIKKNFGLGAETIQKLREDRGGAEISQEIVFDVQGKETDSAIEPTVSAFVDQYLQEALRLHATRPNVASFYRPVASFGFVLLEECCQVSRPPSIWPPGMEWIHRRRHAGLPLALSQSAVGCGWCDQQRTNGKVSRRACRSQLDRVEDTEIAQTQRYCPWPTGTVAMGRVARMICRPATMTGRRYMLSACAFGTPYRDGT